MAGHIHAELEPTAPACTDCGAEPGDEHDPRCAGVRDDMLADIYDRCRKEV